MFAHVMQIFRDIPSYFPSVSSSSCQLLHSTETRDVSDMRGEKCIPIRGNVRYIVVQGRQLYKLTSWDGGSTFLSLS